MFIFLYYVTRPLLRSGRFRLKSLQIYLIDLYSLNVNKNTILNLIGKFCFCLPIRMNAIELLKIKIFKITSENNKKKILTTNIYKMYFKLLKDSHSKNMNFIANMKIISVKISKINKLNVRTLNNNSLSDCVMQLQFLTLLDPIVDSILYFNLYGFRKSLNSFQALAFLIKNIKISNPFQFYLISVDLLKCFDSIYHSFVFKHFPFPQKYNFLLKR